MQLYFSMCTQRVIAAVGAIGTEILCKMLWKRSQNKGANLRVTVIFIFWFVRADPCGVAYTSTNHNLNFYMQFSRLLCEGKVYIIVDKMLPYLST